MEMNFLPGSLYLITGNYGYMITVNNSETISKYKSFFPSHFIHAKNKMLSMHSQSLTSWAYQFFTQPHFWVWFKLACNVHDEKLDKRVASLSFDCKRYV